MSLAFTITLKQDVPELATYLKSKTGKALARESERIESAARRKRVNGPTAYLSESEANVIEQLKADGFDPARMRVPPEQWFPAAEGVTMCKALIEHITANLNDFKQPNPILRDLKAVEALLTAAAAAGVPFHFSSTDL